MIQKIAMIALAFTTTFAFNANAGLLNQYGVVAYSSGEYQGGMGSTSAEIYNSSTSLYGELQTTSYLPTLKGKTTSGYNRILAVQAFQYNGTSPFDLDLSIDLHGSTSGGNLTYLRADVGIIDVGYSISGIEDYYFGYDFATVYFEPSEGSGVDQTTLFINNEQDVNKLDTLSISLNTNQYFYVVSQLTVSAQDGGYADAWNTLNMSFSDSSNLLSAVPAANAVPTSVPEPTTFALFALTLFGFAARKKHIKK